MLKDGRVVLSSIVGGQEAGDYIFDAICNLLDCLILQIIRVSIWRDNMISYHNIIDGI